MKQHGERTRAEPSARIDWPHIRLQQTGTALSFVDRRNSKLAERTDRGFIRPFNIPNRDISKHQRAPIRDIRLKFYGGYGSIFHAPHFHPVFQSRDLASHDREDGMKK
jgi:hypothetical protein